MDHAAHGEMRQLGSIGGQLVLVLLALGMLVLRPPVRGAMLLVPLSGAAARALPALARAHDALILQRGPVSGSLVVMAERGALAMPLLRRGVLTVASPLSGCTAPGKPEA